MPVKTERQYRNMTMAVMPQAEKLIDTDYYVEGYAANYERYKLWDDDEGGVFEQFTRDNFEGVDLSDVIMQYDHTGRVFARNKNGTLGLEADDEGLKITADLGGTEIGRQLYEEIRGGYTDKMSFGFKVGEDSKTETYDSERYKVIVLRTIRKVAKLYDVSAVSIPANDATSISARAYSDGLVEELRAERQAALERKAKFDELKERLNKI